jgi:uncharacterized protein (TIGR02246 family)
MPSDEQAIRDVIDNWARASLAGDLAQLMAMMSEDVVFLTPGRPQCAATISPLPSPA